MTSLTTWKKSNTDGRKKDVAEEELSEATVRCTPSYIPKNFVEKLVIPTSSEPESDTDIENTTENVREADKIKIDKKETNNTIGTLEHCRDDESDKDHYCTPRKRYKLSLTPPTRLRKLNLSNAEIIVNCRRILIGSDQCVCALCLALYGYATEDMPGRESEVTSSESELDFDIVSTEGEY